MLKRPSLTQFRSVECTSLTWTHEHSGVDGLQWAVKMLFHTIPWFPANLSTLSKIIFPLKDSSTCSSKLVISFRPSKRKRNLPAAAAFPKPCSPFIYYNNNNNITIIIIIIMIIKIALSDWSKTRVLSEYKTQKKPKPCITLWIKHPGHLKTLQKWRKLSSAARGF